MKIKKLSRRKLVNALPLVWEVFSEYEAVDYPEEGKRAFRNAIYSEEYLDMLAAYGAYEGGALTGIIATREEGRHLALFFVDGKHHRQGIGRSLWNAVLAENTSPTITVHSSLYAVDVYKKLGFAVTGEMCSEGGIRYVPMEYRMLVNENCREKNSMH
ncbi:MAG: GNAT family N-acetyltransferase [Lachnospiraceae bacterium]